MSRIRPGNLAFLLAVSAALLALLPDPARAARGSLRSRVDAVFADYDRPGSPGCALGVIRDGRLIDKRGYGLASLEHGVPIASDTVFRMASVSKQFTAAAVALLAEEGTLSLDDDVRKHLPEMPAYARPITIRHLIHHTSGLRDYASLAPMAGIHYGDHYTPAESLDLIVRQRGTDFAPGDEYSYSNTGYFLLSQIIPRVTGKSLRAYAQERIFGPLGMTHTHFHDDLNEVVPKRAHGYASAEGGGFTLDMTGWEQVGDGGIFTTIQDLVRWDSNFYDNRLGKGGPALIETLLTPGRLNDGKTIDYAFGLVVDEDRGLKRVSHGGSWVGFRTHMTRYPEQRFSVAVLCNLDTATPGALARRVAEIYLADAFKEPTEAIAAGAAAGAASGRDRARAGAPAAIPEDDLRRLAGHFWSASEKTAREIAVEKGRLVYRSGEGSGTRLIPIDGRRFVMEDDATVVSFPEPGDKAARAMIVTYEGEDPTRFEAFEPARPSAGKLNEYAGAFYCEELDATYVFEPKDRRLAFAVGHVSDARLVPLFPDMFQWDGWVTFSFSRDPSGRVDRLSLDSGRARNLACSKRRG